MVLGGAVAFTRLAPGASKALAGQPWSEATLKAGLQALAADVQSLSPSQGELLAWQGDAMMAEMGARRAPSGLVLLLEAILWQQCGSRLGLPKMHAAHAPQLASPAACSRCLCFELCCRLSCWSCVACASYDGQHSRMAKTPGKQCAEVCVRASHQPLRTQVSGCVQAGDWACTRQRWPPSSSASGYRCSPHVIHLRLLAAACHGRAAPSPLLAS